VDGIIVDMKTARVVWNMKNIPLAGCRKTYEITGGHIPQVDYTRQVKIIEDGESVQLEAIAWVHGVKVIQPNPLIYELDVVTTEEFHTKGGPLP